MRRICVILAVVLVPMLVPSCGGGETGMDVRKPPAERPDFDRSVVQRGALKIPAAEGFNYTSFRSGQSGTGRGESKPEGKNGAVCRAEAGDESGAWGEFQLGYCFDNAGDAPLDAIVKLNLKVSEKNESKGAAASGEALPATAKSMLTFFIKDSYGEIIKTENLMATSLGKGPNASGIVHELVFDARFEPQRGYYLMLAGRSEAQSFEGQSASVALEVKDAAMEIEWRPAGTASVPGRSEAVASHPPESGESAP
ncbi:MAG TPA: hypothetical protein VJZ71_03315 [Phycisphaerae bacterium]|nr:hypothetical protein [Phycisphaerae bacterium]